MNARVIRARIGKVTAMPAKKRNRKRVHARGSNRAVRKERVESRRRCVVNVPERPITRPERSVLVERSRPIRATNPYNEKTREQSVEKRNVEINTQAADQCGGAQTRSRRAQGSERIRNVNAETRYTRVRKRHQFEIHPKRR